MPDVLQEVLVRCKGAAYMGLDELTPLQGNLKTLSRTNFDKLKTSLLAHGFAFPFYVWKDRSTNWILDGHQRDVTLREIAQERDVRLPKKYPVVFVQARNKTEACKLLLLASSQYGEITDEGLYEYINFNDLNMADLRLEVSFDAIDFEKFTQGWGSDTHVTQGGGTTGADTLECPNCHHRFEA